MKKNNSSTSNMNECKNTSITSTTDRGNQFRDAVAALLRTRHENVEIEKRIGGKNVDVAYTEFRYGKTFLYAVECKDYKKPLTSDFLCKEVFPSYRPLIDQSLINHLLIVSNKPLGSAAKERIDIEKNISYLTYEELEEDILGLRNYVERLSTVFQIQELESYYVETRFDEGETSAYIEVENWIKKSNSAPLAILGGYGQGKTSLATRIVAEQAKKHLADRSERIPILIRLGEIVHETTLEGLFGKEFTSKFKTNYHYDTFQHLNQNGRLLVVLDGFDEMKHGMTSSDFKSNFAEFNRLICEKSKIILLGRPSAFSSETRNLVLRGRRLISGQEIVAPGVTPWLEKSIAGFLLAETKQFLKNYIIHLIKKNVGRDGILEIEQVENRIDEILLDVSHDLLCRPVHARIIAELAVSPKFSFKGFTEYDLYSQFIRQIIERDSDHKRARKKIPSTDRLLFQRRLAFWAWTRPNQVQSTFLREHVPPVLLVGLNDGDTFDDEGKLNEYIVSTVTDSKDAGNLCFSHRSFQEFLVAEYLTGSDAINLNHDKRSDAIDEAVSQFILNGPNPKVIETWFETLPCNGRRLSSTYINLFCSRKEVYKILERRISDDLRYDDQISGISIEEVAVLGNLVLSKIPSKQNRLKITQYLKRLLVTADKNTAALAFHYTLRIEKTKKDWISIIEQVLLERRKFQEIVARRNDRVAYRIVLGDDGSIDTLTAALSKSKIDGCNSICWNINRTYENVSRLVRSLGKLLLDDAPTQIDMASLKEGMLFLNAKDFDAKDLNIEFDDVIQWIPKSKDRT